MSYLVDHPDGELGAILLVAGRVHDPDPDADFTIQLLSHLAPSQAGHAESGRGRRPGRSQGRSLVRRLLCGHTQRTAERLLGAWERLGRCVRHDRPQPQAPVRNQNRALGIETVLYHLSRTDHRIEIVARACRQRSQGFLVI